MSFFFINTNDLVFKIFQFYSPEWASRCLLSPDAFEKLLSQILQIFARTPWWMTSLCCSKRYEWMNDLSHWSQANERTPSCTVFLWIDRLVKLANNLLHISQVWDFSPDQCVWNGNWNESSLSCLKSDGKCHTCMWDCMPFEGENVRKTFIAYFACMRTNSFMNHLYMRLQISQMMEWALAYVASVLFFLIIGCLSRSTFT